MQIAAGRPLVVLVVNKNMLSSVGGSPAESTTVRYRYTVTGSVQEGLSNVANLSMTRFMKSTVIGTINKMSGGYIGGARLARLELESS